MADSPDGYANLYDKGAHSGVEAGATSGFATPLPVKQQDPFTAPESTPDYGAGDIVDPVAVNPVTCVPVHLPAGGGVNAGVGFDPGTSSACAFDIVAGPSTDGGDLAPQVTPGELASIAVDEAMALADRPTLRIAPERIGLTGLPTYVWLEATPRPVSASASVPGVTVTAEARPVQYRWSFGDGEDKVTSDPGRPWTKARRGSIAYTYETKGHYEVEVEVVWSARWRIGDGEWRRLGYFSNSDSRDYAVRQVISVLTQQGD